MKISNNFDIKIFYKLINSDAWFTWIIDPYDYFDHHYYEDDEEIEIDSIPLHDHAINYIHIETPQAITHTNLLIRDLNSKEQIQIKESYWNNHNNNIIERIDSGGAEDYHLLIITTMLTQNPTVFQIMRFEKLNDHFEVKGHYLITKNEDGTETEHRVL